MTDWKSTCEAFNQFTPTQYPNNCTLASAKTVKELITLSDTVSRLRGKQSALGTDYQDGNANARIEDDKTTLRTSMNDFCCAMWARTEYDERYKEAVLDYDIAKRRVESVRNPPANLSYMGTVIPLPRPLRSDSVPILLITSLIFCILALGMLLNLGNVQLAYVGPRSYGPGFFQMLAESFRQTSWMVLSITVVVSAGLAGGIYYAIQKYNPDQNKT
jgi:hypothetical protein